MRANKIAFAEQHRPITRETTQLIHELPGTQLRLLLVFGDVASVGYQEVPRQENNAHSNGIHVSEFKKRKTMYQEQQRAGAVSENRPTPARPKTTQPGVGALTSAAGAVPLSIVAPPPSLARDPNAQRFFAALGRIARRAVEEGRAPAVAGNAARNRAAAGLSDPAAAGSGGGQDDGYYPRPPRLP